MTPSQADQLVKDWNNAHPVGAKVMRYKLIRPLREGNETKTRSDAFVCGAGIPAIFVEGVSGFVLLESVQPI